MTSPDITVAVCTYNRANLLRTALASLVQLDTPDLKYEVLVVDNNSSDHTREVAEEFSESTAAGSAVAVRYVREERQGVVYARNCAIENANGEWLAYFDDDQVADANWLTELRKAADEQQVRCVGGAVHIRLPEGNDRQLSNVCKMLLGATVRTNEPQAYTPNFTPGTGNLLVKKDVFDEIGVFDAAFNSRGEDTDLFMRMYNAGVKAWFHPSAIIYHCIDEDRLTDEAFLNLSKVMSNGMSLDEHRAKGPWLYPSVWFARVVQGYGLIPLKRLAATVTGNREEVLGQRCRFAVAHRMIADGWKLMWQGEPKAKSSPAPTTQTVSAS